MAARRRAVLTHPPRPPIPLRPLDEAAAEAARAAGHGPLGAWLAGVSGAAPGLLRDRAVDAGAAAAGAAEPLAVAAVAALVDRGRELAQAAAADGVTVLVARGGTAPGHLVAWLAGEPPPGPPEAAPRGPLGALRRWGAPSTCVACGLALGAGEHGLGLLCDGLDALAGAAVAMEVEPGVRPRVLAADAGDGPPHAALLARLRVPVAARAGGAAAALAALRG